MGLVLVDGKIEYNLSRADFNQLQVLNTGEIVVVSDKTMNSMFVVFNLTKNTSQLMSVTEMRTFMCRAVEKGSSFKYE